MQGNHRTDFDVVIVGSGLVGSAFALALRDSGLSIGVVEAKPPLPLVQDDSWDSRIYAISPGNAAFLDSLDIWSSLDHARIASIHAMQIFGDDNVANLNFGAYQANLPELAFILENRLLQDALWQAMQQQEEVEIICPAQCATLDMKEDGATLTLADGRVLRAKLVVGADGAHSWVRSQAGIEARPQPYQQMGVVANFETALPHGDIARQWFRKDGVLAWLPLPGNRISIVWSTWDERAQDLVMLPPEPFEAEVASAGNDVLGALRLITPPAAFPLRLMRLEHWVAPRLALIGDAAHNVHPLAGQGVNLGFQDAKVLAQVLRERGPWDCGAQLLLRRYERARKEDVLAMQGVTDALQKLFNNTSPVLGALRNLGLHLTDSQPWLKNALVQHALR